MTLAILLKILHIATAAAWFGLILAIPGKIRRGLAVGGDAARFAVTEGERAQKLALIMGGATIVFGVALVLSEGSFKAQPRIIHMSLGLAIVLLAFGWLVTKRACAEAGGALSLGDSVRLISARKRLAMACGIEQLLWLMILVLMVWRP